MDLLPQRQSDAHTRLARFIGPLEPRPRPVGLGPLLPTWTPPTFIWPQCRGAGCQQTHTTFQNKSREQQSQESEGDLLAFTVRSHEDRSDRMRFSLVVNAGKELRNARIFCLSSSTMRAARRRALDSCDLGVRLPRGSVTPARHRCTHNLPGSFFLFFFLSQPDQPPGGKIWGYPSNPSCPDARMYSCWQQQDKITRRGNKFRESSCASSTGDRGGLLGKGRPVGVLLERRHSPPRGGQGGSAVHETWGCDHPVEAEDRDCSAGTGPGRPHPTREPRSTRTVQRAEGTPARREGRVGSAPELGRCGQSRPGEAHGGLEVVLGERVGVFGGPGKGVQQGDGTSRGTESGGTWHVEGQCCTCVCVWWGCTGWRRDRGQEGTCGGKWAPSQRGVMGRGALFCPPGSGRVPEMPPLGRDTPARM